VEKRLPGDSYREDPGVCNLLRNPPEATEHEAGDLRSVGRSAPKRRVACVDILEAAARRRAALRPWEDLRPAPPDAPVVQTTVRVGPKELDTSLEAAAALSVASLEYVHDTGSVPPPEWPGGAPPAPPVNPPKVFTATVPKKSSMYLADDDQSDASDADDPIGSAPGGTTEGMIDCCLDARRGEAEETHRARHFPKTTQAPAPRASSTSRS